MAPRKRQLNRRQALSANAQAWLRGDPSCDFFKFKPQEELAALWAEYGDIENMFWESLVLSAGEAGRVGPKRSRRGWRRRAQLRATEVRNILTWRTRGAIESRQLTTSCKKAAAIRLRPAG